MNHSFLLQSFAATFVFILGSYVAAYLLMLRFALSHESAAEHVWDEMIECLYTAIYNESDVNLKVKHNDTKLLIPYSLSMANQERLHDFMKQLKRLSFSRQSLRFILSIRYNLILAFLFSILATALICHPILSSAKPLIAPMDVLAPIGSFVSIAYVSLIVSLLQQWQKLKTMRARTDKDFLSDSSLKFLFKNDYTC